MGYIILNCVFVIVLLDFMVLKYMGYFVYFIVVLIKIEWEYICENDVMFVVYWCKFYVI